MSKNKQIIIFSVIGLAVLAAVAALLMLTAPQPEGDPDSDSGEESEILMLVDSDGESISSLSVSNESGKYDIVHNEEKDEWLIESIAQAPLNQSVFTSIIEQASNLTAKAVVEENPDDLAKYGLENPGVSFTSNFDSGRKVTIEIGNEAPSESSTYVKISGNDTVYICQTSKLKNFYNSSFDFVSTVMMEPYDTESVPVVEKLIINRTDMAEPVVIEALPEKDEDEINVYSHKFTSPYDVYLDLNNGNNLLYALYGLTASRIEWVGMEEQDYEWSGLDNPTCTVSMLAEGKETELKIGKAIVSNTVNEKSGVTTQTVTGYYAMISTVPDVLYVIPLSSAPWMSMTLETYMSKLFCVPYIFDLASVSYEDKNTRFTVNINGNAEESSFTVDGEEIDESRFKELYQYLIGAKGETLYTDSEKGELIASFTYKYKDSTMKDDVIAFYESDDRRPIIEVNGKNLFKTKQMYTIRLQENAAAFLNGGEISLNY